MSEQTIDGVPGLRAQLTDIANRIEHNYPNTAKELRALVDAPEPLWNPHPAVANLAALLIKLAQHGVKVSGGKGDEPWTVEPAAQPQGEPVAWYKPHWRGGSAEWSLGAKLPDVVFPEMWEPLYAEQPAQPLGDSPASILLGGRRPGKAHQAAQLESLAKTVYDSWQTQPGWVPWVDGGNSLKQDEARRIARRTFELALANLGD